MKSLSGFRGVLLLTLVNLFSQIARFCFQTLLSRAVTTEVLGLYQLVLSVQPVLMSLTAVGATSACTQLTARYAALGNFDGVRQTLRACLRAFLLAFGIVTALLLPLRGFVASSLLGDRRTAAGLALLLPLILLTGVENIHKSFFYGIGAVKIPALTEIGEQLVRIGGVLGLLWYLSPSTPARSVILILAGLLLSEVFSALTLTPMAHRFLRRRPAGTPLSPQALRRNYRAIALPVGFSALLGNLLNAQTVALIPRALTRSGLSADAALSALGVLQGMTLPLLALPTVAVMAMAPVLLPKIAHAAARGQKDLCRCRLNQALTASALWCFPTAALLAVLAPMLGELIFRQSSVGEHAPLLAVALIFDSLGGILSVTLCGMGEQKRVSCHGLVAGAARLTLTWVLMARLGLGGYATAMLLTALLELWLNGRHLIQKLDWKPPYFSALFAPALAACLAAFCGALLLPILSPLGTLPACGGTLLFGLIVYLCALSAMGISIFSTKSLTDTF